MNTVGYGDIGPSNLLEKRFCCVFIIVACGFFGYMLNQIGSIIQSFSKDEQELQNSLGILNRFINKRNSITFGLKIKLKKYFEFLYEEEKIQNDEEEEDMLNQLSGDLYDQLVLESNGPILKQIQCLVQNFSEETLQKTVKILNKVRYAPGDKIIKQNSIIDQSIYFIQSGEVQVYLEGDDQQKILQTLGNNQVFGEISFFTSMNRSASIKCTKYSRIYNIKQNDFLAILKENPQDYQKFCEIRDKINLYQNFENIPSFHCFSCENKNFRDKHEQSHFIHDCPMMHYVPCKDILIAKYNFSTEQVRDSNYKRRKKSKDQRVNALIYVQCLRSLNINMKEYYNQLFLNFLKLQSSTYLTPTSQEFTSTQLDQLEEMSRDEEEEDNNLEEENSQQSKKTHNSPQSQFLIQHILENNNKNLQLPNQTLLDENYNSHQFDACQFRYNQNKQSSILKSPIREEHEPSQQSYTNNFMKEYSIKRIFDFTDNDDLFKKKTSELSDESIKDHEDHEYQINSQIENKLSDNILEQSEKQSNTSILLSPTRKQKKKKSQFNNLKILHNLKRQKHQNVTILKNPSKSSIMSPQQNQLLKNNIKIPSVYQHLNSIMSNHNNTPFTPSNNRFQSEAEIQMQRYTRNTPRQLQKTYLSMRTQTKKYTTNIEHYYDQNQFFQKFEIVKTYEEYFFSGNVDQVIIMYKLGQQRRQEALKLQQYQKKKSSVGKVSIFGTQPVRAVQRKKTSVNKLKYAQNQKLYFKKEIQSQAFDENHFREILEKMYSQQKNFSYYLREFCNSLKSCYNSCTRFCKRLLPSFKKKKSVNK